MAFYLQGEGSSIIIVYKVQCFIGTSGNDKTDNLTCENNYDNFTCENYRFSNNHESFWIFYIDKKDCMLVLNMIFLTRSLRSLVRYDVQRSK